MCVEELAIDARLGQTFKRKCVANLPLETARGQEAHRGMVCRQHERPTGKLPALRVYEAHVGMSSEEPKVASYADFKGKTLPGFGIVCSYQPDPCNQLLLFANATGSCTSHALTYCLALSARTGCMQTMCCRVLRSLDTMPSN